MAYKVSLSPSARQDIQSIVRYISLDSPKRGLEFGQLLIAKANSIGDHPNIGRIVPEIGDPDIREIIVRAYRVIYRINHQAEKIQIIRFWHGKRGVPDLFS